MAEKQGITRGMEGRKGEKAEKQDGRGRERASKLLRGREDKRKKKTDKNRNGKDRRKKQGVTPSTGGIEGRQGDKVSHRERKKEKMKAEKQGVARGTGG